MTATLAMEIITKVCGPVDSFAVDPTGDGHVISADQAANLGTALKEAGFSETKDADMTTWKSGDVEIVVELDTEDDEPALILNFVTY